MKTWQNCYGKPWGDLVAPGLVKHPAKYSRALIYRIAAHVVRSGYVQSGDTVLDPFGGVALGAIPFIQRGIHWAGVELEEHFVALALANIDKWNAEFGPHIRNWGKATIYHGDSRYLLPLVARAQFAAVVSSPPYGEQGGGRFESGDVGQGGQENLRALSSGYGTSSGQLGEMTGDDFAAVVSSPPYAQSLHQRGHGIDKGKFSRPKDRGREVPAIDAIGNGYGAVVSSPPYADSVNSERHGVDFSQAKPDYPGRKMHPDRLAQLDANHVERRYGSGTANLGTATGDTFWAASKLIVTACYDLLRPGGVAIWVVKDYCRDFQLVPFCDRWLDLCLACGFEHVETIIASMVEERGKVQLGLFGDDAPLEKRHGGLFRRIYESKGGPVVDSEQVLILSKSIP